MQQSRVFPFISKVLENMPADWIGLTTHRLDIYNEEQAKTEFLNQFEKLYQLGQAKKEQLAALPTAYDYIRLGHPLSSVLEWMLATLADRKADSVISFSSQTMSILSVLRYNSLQDIKTRLVFEDQVITELDVTSIRDVYDYDFEIVELDGKDLDLESYEGTTIYVTAQSIMEQVKMDHVDFTVHLYGDYGSILTVLDEKNEKYIAEIQHVRRRETVAMTPQDTYDLMDALVNGKDLANKSDHSNKARVKELIQEVSGINTKPIVGTSGLSIQYAIMMGLVDHAREKHAGKAIKFIVPTNCYGGTNDQARRVAECLGDVEIVDLHVDGDSDMVTGLRTILDDLSDKDAVPYIIAEIPTNPRVEVPDLSELEEVLLQSRKTNTGNQAIPPVFISGSNLLP